MSEQQSPRSGATLAEEGPRLVARVEDEGPRLRAEDPDVVHLVNRRLGWELRETAKGMLTDGHVNEDLQRDRVRQIVQWLQHFPDRLPEMEGLTSAGREALSRARRKEQRDSGTLW